MRASTRGWPCIAPCASASSRTHHDNFPRHRDRSAPYIVCEDLFKIHKSDELEVVALRGLDLKVRAGELMAIVGASGSGKSTLLNILAGLDQPSAGRAFVGGRDLLTMTEGEMVRYRRSSVGFIWQQDGPQPHPLPHGHAER